MAVMDWFLLQNYEYYSERQASILLKNTKYLILAVAELA